jgi:hypothetical protein
MDALLYVANALNFLSYFVRDILHLRTLTITAAVCLALYFASRPEPLMEVVYWNLFFLAMNVFQIARILISRRRAAMEAAIA